MVCYLLNVGPMANGEIPQASIERLKDVGEWMSVNFSIYGTTASPFIRSQEGIPQCDQFGIYWPEISGRFAQQVYFLADFQQQIQVNKTQEGIVLELPDKPLDEIDTVIVLKIIGKLDVERILPRQDGEGVHQWMTYSLLDAYLDGWTDQSRVDPIIIRYL